MPPHYCQVGVEVQVPHLASFDILWVRGTLLFLGRGGSSCFPLGFHWHPPRAGREQDNLLLLPVWAPTDTTGSGVRFIIIQQGWKSLALHSDFSTTTPVGEKEHFVAAGQASKSRLPIKPLLMGVVGDGAAVFCGARLDLCGYCLKVSVLPGCPFPGPLARGTSYSCSCFCLCPLAFLGYWLLQYSA